MRPGLHLRADARRRRVGTGVEYPQRVADQMTRSLGKLNQQALKLVDEFLIPAIAKDDPVEINIALGKIQDAIEQEWPDSRIEEIAQKNAEQANRFHANKFYGALALAIGVTIKGSDAPTAAATLTGVGGGRKPPVAPTLIGATPPGGTFAVKVSVAPELFADEFVAENVKFIGELRSGIVKGLEDAVVRARQFGVPGVRGEGPEELARRLREIWAKNGVPSQLPTTRLKANGEPVMLSTSKHALMVAEDQLAKLNANLNRSRQEASGIDSYVWETRGDNRVREAHRVLNGKRFTWESGGAPGEGHPGEAPRCRCTAAPVLDRNKILKNFIPL